MRQQKPGFGMHLERPLNATILSAIQRVGCFTLHESRYLLSSRSGRQGGIALKGRDFVGASVATHLNRIAQAERERRLVPSWHPDQLLLAVKNGQNIANTLDALTTLFLKLKDELWKMVVVGPSLEFDEIRHVGTT